VTSIEQSRTSAMSMEGPQSRLMPSQSRIKLASLQGKAIEADTYVLILKAAQQAVGRSAMTEAVAQLQKGLDLLKSMPDNSARQQQEFDLRIALGRARIATKGWAFPPGGETYARARLLAEQLDRQDCLFPLLGGQFIFHLIHPPLA
jgi:predicted ATPase